MEHSRKQKLLMIIALVVGIASLSVGFAAFSVSLNISSSASVTPNSSDFSVKFSISKDNLVGGHVVPSSQSDDIEVGDGFIENSGNPTIRNFWATFYEPGQFVEFLFYARNEGEYTAYLNNINFIGEKVCVNASNANELLVQNVCDYINILVTIDGVTYNETTAVTGHALAKNTGEEIIVRLEYDENGPYVDGPLSITFPYVSLVYSSIDDSSILPTIPEKLVRVVSGDLNTIGSVVAIGNEQFYVIGQDNGNVKLLSMYNLHVGNSVDENYNVTPLVNPTGIQDEETIGNMSEVNGTPTGVTMIGTTAFSNINATYSGSIVEGYVNNYLTYLEGLGANIEEARLITKEELEVLGCSGYDHSCSEAPDFVYKTSYWSESVVDSYDVWFVNFDAGFGFCIYNYDSGLGVRPVIIISTSEF